MNKVQKCKNSARRILANSLYYSGALKLFDHSPGWRILMYHRITTPELCGHPLQPGMYVRPEHFAKQIAYLSEHTNVLPLEALCEKVANKEPLPPRSVAITFDDGWRDNFEFALPVLRKHNLPATVFLATSFIGSNDTLWSDAVPAALHALQSKQGSCKVLSKSDFRPKIVQMTEEVLQQAISLDIEPLDSLVHELKNDSESDRHRYVTALRECAGLQSIPVDSERSFLNWDEVAQMSASAISFGCHTHRHIPLSELNETQILAELQESLDCFANNQLDQSSVFCYPEGRYSELSQQALQQSGFSYALSVEQKTNHQTKPPLLGRLGIHDDISSTVPLFAARLWTGR